MNIQDVTTVISTVGFPIAMCLMLCWYIYKNNQLHRDEMKQVTEALNNNTLAIQKLIDKLEV